MECIECVDHLHQVDDGADVSEGVLAVEIHMLPAHRADPLDLLGLIFVQSSANSSNCFTWVSFAIFIAPFFDQRSAVSNRCFRFSQSGITCPSNRKKLAS